MSFDKKDLLLYAVTDRGWLGTHSLPQAVESAINGGASMVQLREKGHPYSNLLDDVYEIKALCEHSGIPFIINDDVDLALSCDAGGVHVGQDDMDVKTVRQRIGEGKILGVSAQTVAQAKLAEKNGADYLGVGAVFLTDTKKDAAFVEYDTLKAICEAVSIPVVAIGGIGEHNIRKLEGSGICGVALVSAIFAAKDVSAATTKMLRLAEETVKSQKG